MYIIIFSKKFLTGSLAGMTVPNQKLEVENMQEVKKWAWNMGAGTDKVNKEILTRNQYTIPEWRYEHADK